MTIGPSDMRRRLQSMCRIERYKGELLPELENEWPHPFRKPYEDLYEFSLQQAIVRAQANGNLQLAQKYEAMLSRLRE